MVKSVRPLKFAHTGKFKNLCIIISSESNMYVRIKNDMLIADSIHIYIFPGQDRKLRKLCFCKHSKERSDGENGVYVFLFIPNFVSQKVERWSLKTENRTRKEDREISVAEFPCQF